MKKRAIALLCLILALSLLWACGGGTDKEKSPTGTGTRPTGRDPAVHKQLEETIQFQFDVRYNGQYARLADLAPGEYWTLREQERGQTLAEALAERASDWPLVNANQEALYGQDFHVTYTLQAWQPLSQEDRAGVIGALEARYGIDADRIQQIYDAEGALNYRGSRKEHTDRLKVSVVCCDGQWYCMGWECTDGVYTATFLTG